MLAVRNSFADPPSEEALLEWHRLIRTGHRHTAAGQWQTHAEPMQVVSGAVRHERVHSKAPPSSHISKEMARFIQWFNDTAPDGPTAIRKAAVRSAIAHLYFESIHPFEDGRPYQKSLVRESVVARTWTACLAQSLANHRSQAARLLRGYYDALKESR